MPCFGRQLVFFPHFDLCLTLVERLGQKCLCLSVCLCALTCGFFIVWLLWRVVVCVLVPVGLDADRIHADLRDDKPAGRHRWHVADDSQPTRRSDLANEPDHDTDAEHD